MQPDCQPDRPIHQEDVLVAFLKSPIKGEVNVKITLGHEETDSKTGAPMVRKLKRYQYGLTQSPALRYGVCTNGIRPVLIHAPGATKPWRRIPLYVATCVW